MRRMDVSSAEKLSQNTRSHPVAIARHQDLFHSSTAAEINPA